ncbi:ABC transporter substrate-binding protein [Halomicrococcus gelatinilyticus]|uniref:ABC transporter substrate-binding protein n=1 Tax=Halomicrococcus gelatinilyticus TaxID=1702103 RepID=UPI002E0F6E3B
MPYDGRTSTRRRQYLRAVAGVGLAGGLAGCTGNQGDSGGTTTDGGDGGGGSGPIPVGNLSPFSGGLGWIGPQAKKAIKVALDEINGEKVLGRTIQIQRQDSETKPQAAISGFQTLDSKGVKAVVGPSSTVMPSLVQPAKDAKLGIVSPMTGTIQLDDTGGEWIWRTVPSDSVAGRAQARYSYSDKDYRKMALAYKNDKGSKSFSASVGNYFETLGGDVVTEVALAPKADSYRSEIQKLMDSGAGVVSMTAATEVTSLFIKNYTELGAEFDMFLSNDVITQSFVDKVGAQTMKGMLGQAPASGPASDAFAGKYEERHGESPGIFANSAYDAINLIALAFQKEGSASRAAIKNHLHDLGNPPGKKVKTFPEGKKALENGEKVDYVGAANPQNFDETGDPLGPFSVMRVQNGEWSEVKTYSADRLSE